MERKTLNDVRNAVCTVTQTSPKELRKRKERSTKIETIAKALIIYFVKEEKGGSLASNRELRQALGYGTNNKPILYHLKRVKEAIEVRDPEVMPFFDKVVRRLMSRQYHKQEIETLTLKCVGNSIDGQQTVIELKEVGVYPFVVRTGNMLLHYYGTAENGAYIGQTEQEYNTAIM